MGRADRARPRGRLADLAEAKKHGNLVGRIEQHLLAQKDKPTDRRQDVLHPSEMAKADWCPRQSYYRLSGATPMNPQAEKMNYVLEAIFEEGHEIHRKWQKWLQDIGVLWGDWECPVCKNRMRQVTFPGRCFICYTDHGIEVFYEYKEVPLQAESKYLIAGHEDGADIEQNALVEIKSIGIGTLRMEEPELLKKHHKTVDGKKIYDIDGIWRDLKRPLRSHVKQTGIYLALCEEMGLPFDKVIFIYEFKANQQRKEFVLKPSKEIIQPLLDAALEIRRELAAGEHGEPVDRPDFIEDRDNKTCKACVFQDLCWGKEEDGAGTEPTPEVSRRPRRRLDVGSGETVREGRSEAADGDAGDAGAAGRRRPRFARGSNGPERQRPDETVLTADGVDGVRRRTPRSSRGRRESV